MIFADWGHCDRNGIRAVKTCATKSEEEILMVNQSSQVLVEDD